jgi:hypothetical protein
MSQEEMNHTDTRTYEAIMKLLESTTRLETKVENLTYMSDRQYREIADMDNRVKKVENSTSKIIGMATAVSVAIGFILPFVKEFIT